MAKLGLQGDAGDLYDSRLLENRIHTEEIEGLPDDVKQAIKNHLMSRGRPVHLSTSKDPDGMAGIPENTQIYALYKGLNDNQAPAEQPKQAVGQAPIQPSLTMRDKMRLRRMARR